MNSLFSTFPLDSHHTYVCSMSSVRFAPTFPHNLWNRSAFSDLDLIKLIILMALFKMERSTWLIFFEAGASLRIIQCVLNTSGFSFLMCVMRTLKWPVIAAAASVHTLVQDFQSISLYKKKQLTMLKMSVVSSRRLQKRMSSLMSSLSTYFAKAMSSTSPLISVESSNCNENSSTLGYLTTYILISLPILLILSETASHDSSTVLILASTALSTIISPSTAAAGTISSSATLNIFFQISSKLLSCVF